MADLVQQITEGLEKHVLWFSPYNDRHQCICDEWCDSGPGMKRVRHNFREHVATKLADRLNLHEERGWTTEKLDALPLGSVVMTASPRLIPDCVLWTRADDDKDGNWWRIGSDDSFKADDVLYMQPEVVRLLFRPGQPIWVSGWTEEQQ